jgi:protein dithiol oxidoreductase (disulfide-forming)
MLKRLPLLCTALLMLAACNSNNGGNAAAPPTPAADSTAATTPAATTPAPTPATSAGSAPAAVTSAAATPAPAEPAYAAAPEAFVDSGKWVEGKNYFLIEPSQPTTTPGKIEVTEVFSYGCPACFQFHTMADQLARTLPAGAVMTYLPASFRPDENWPLYQRAYYTAQALGVAEKTHDAMFDAIFKSGELGITNMKTNRPRPKSEWPTIDDVAKFYAQYGVTAADFVATANSFTINTKMKRADELMKAYGVESTPTIVVNGKYRLTTASAGGYPQTLELTQWLVSKEAAGK